MSRDEALTATWVAARALLATVDLRQQSGTPYVPVAVHLLTQLGAAVDAVEAVGDDTVTTTATFWCAAPDCWRQNDTAGMYCHQHSDVAALPSARVVRRDALFEVQDDA